tara:strand:- start:589 stop:2286 length:1698 start_codon:yes stop_codon:yes gene_type:complete
MRYAIATASIAAASGTTPASGTAVLAERINGVVTPITSDYRTEVSISQGGPESVAGGGGTPRSTASSGASNGGDDIGKREAVWTVTPVGSIFGNDRPYSASSLTTIPASQIFPYYNFEDDGTDWSGRGLDLTVTSGSYSTTRVVGSKSANFQNACHFSHAHNEYFSGSDGAGIRISFWIYPVALGSGGALDFQGIITKGSVNTGTGSAVFTGDWGIFYAQNAVAGTKDLHVVIKTTGIATFVLHSMALSTGAWYFIDVVINNYGESTGYGGVGTYSVSVRGAATANTGDQNIIGEMLGDSSQLLRIGNNSEGDKLGDDSARFYIDAVSFSNDFTSPTTDEMYNSGSAYSTGYTNLGVASYLPSAATSLVTGTYQVRGDSDVHTAITDTTGAVRPAIKITKPASTSADVSIEAGTSTSKFVADFTADPSVGTVRQTSNPKAAEVVWKGRYANYPIEIHESDNGMIVTAEKARVSECFVDVTSVGAGAPDTARANASTGPQDMGGTVASGAVTRDKGHGEASDPEAAATALGYSPGASITVRNPTSSSYSSGNVLRIEREGNGWVIL